MEINLLMLPLFKMTIFSFKEFMKKYNLKDATSNESDLQRIYNYPIYPIDFKTYSDNGSVSIDNGSMCGTHWTCFLIKDNKFYYFDSFGGTPDKFLLKHLHKPIIYNTYKIQDITSKLCGSYCLYFFYLLE